MLTKNDWFESLLSRLDDLEVEEEKKRAEEEATESSLQPPNGVNFKVHMYIIIWSLA